MYIAILLILVLIVIMLTYFLFIAKSSECEGSELPSFVLEAKEMCRKAKEEQLLTLEKKKAKLK